MNWRNGIEKDIDEVLQIPYIFVNATKVFICFFSEVIVRELQLVIMT